MTDAEKADLKAKYPKAQFLKVGPYELVLKTPTRGDYLKFKAMLNGTPMEQNLSGEFLLRASCAYPSIDELTRILDECPGLPDAIGKQLATSTGARLEIQLGE